MAARNHIVSRRALLGAAWAVSTALAASPRRRGSSSSVIAPSRPIGAGPSPDRWTRALARFRRAEAALAAAAHEPDDDRFDAINTRFNAALRHIVRTPAPDLAALSAKIDLAVDQDIATLTGGERCLAVLKQDARRLAFPAHPELVEGSS